MTYYKVRIEGWTKFNPAAVELEVLAHEMVEGSAKCTLQKTLKRVEKIEGLPTEVQEFFG